MANAFDDLEPPRHALAPYVNAFRMGRALASEPAAPPAATQGPAAGDRVAGRVAALTADERASGARQAELLANVGIGLKAVPYAERRAVLGHMTPALAARGVPVGEVAAFDPTDAAIDAVVAQAERLGRMLAPANR